MVYSACYSLIYKVILALKYVTCSIDSAELVQILLDAGAHANTKNGSHSPLELAEDLESLHIVEIIQKNC